MDSPGIEPGAFCMQNRRDTTTPQTLSKNYNFSYLSNNINYTQFSKIGNPIIILIGSNIYPIQPFFKFSILTLSGIFF